MLAISPQQHAGAPEAIVSSHAYSFLDLEMEEKGYDSYGMI